MTQRSGYRLVELTEGEKQPKAKGGAAPGGFDMGGLMKLLGSFTGNAGAEDEGTKLARSDIDMEEDEAILESNRRRSGAGLPRIDVEGFTDEVEEVRGVGFEPNAIENKGAPVSVSPGTASATKFDLSGYKPGASTADDSLKNLDAYNAMIADQQTVADVPLAPDPAGQDDEYEEVSEEEIAGKKKSPFDNIKKDDTSYNKLLLLLTGLGSSLGGALLSKATGGTFTEGALGGGAAGFGAVNQFVQGKEKERLQGEKYAHAKELAQMRYGGADGKGGSRYKMEKIPYYAPGSTEVSYGIFNPNGTGSFTDAFGNKLPDGWRPAHGTPQMFTAKDGSVFVFDKGLGTYSKAPLQGSGMPAQVEKPAPSGSGGAFNYNTQPPQKKPAGVASTLPKTPEQTFADPADPIKYSPVDSGLIPASPKVYDELGITDEVIESLTSLKEADTPQQAASYKDITDRYNKLITDRVMQQVKNVDDHQKEIRAVTRDLQKLEIQHKNRLKEINASKNASGQSGGLKPPPGYRYTESGDLEAIPGGPAAQKIETTEEKAAARQAANAMAGLTVVQDLGRAMEIIESSNLAAGPIMGRTSKIPFAPAYTVEQLLESVKSNIGIDRLQAMRDSSPTGGALGQVPFQQQQRLEQLLGSLEITQKEDVLLDNIRRVSNMYLDIVHGPGNGPPRYELSFDDMGKKRTGGGNSNEKTINGVRYKKVPGGWERVK